MRFYQDSRGYDCFYYASEGSQLYAGAAGAFYSLEDGDTDIGAPIPLTWISRTSDQGLPNNPKTYQDVVIDHNTGGASLTVTAVLDNGSTTVTLGTIASIIRTQTTLRIGDEFGRTSLNIAIEIKGDKASNDSACELFGVILHWYPEARKSLTWDSDELSQGTQKVKAYRAIQLDMNNPGAVTVLVYTDMPGNAMAQRGVAHTVPASSTRRDYQIPLGRPYIEGRKVRVIVKSTDGVTEFQLYGGRIEVQVFGEYVESYEATAGREWDSGTLDLGFPGVKEIKEARLDVDTGGALTFDLHTDLPGLNMVSRSTKTVNTETTTTSRRTVNLPLLSTGLPVEGNLARAFLRGTAEWKLYGAWLFARPIGYYVEAYTAADGHIWDSTIIDLGSPQVKRLLQVFFEAHGDSPMTVKVYTSSANGDMALRDTQTLAASAGRKPYIVPLTSVYGRLVRVTISSTGAFRLFVVKALVKPIGVYLNGGTSEVFPVEAEQDIDTERVKLFKEIEVVYSGSGTLEFASDTAGPVEVIRSFTLTTSADTRTDKLRLPKEAKGRILRALLRPGSTDLQVFSIRVWTRTVGENGAVLWQWVPLPIPATPDNYGWADIHVAPTPPAYAWQEIYVAPTDTPKWDWADLPVKP